MPNATKRAALASSLCSRTSSFTSSDYLNPKSVSSGHILATHIFISCRSHNPMSDFPAQIHTSNSSTTGIHDYPTACSSGSQSRVFFSTERLGLALQAEIAQLERETPVILCITKNPAHAW
ncbi:hypothetical protein K439DRAFT_401847 [Ramaria rubella]|nr:hypothetical protein K439DRAFT_401847 [Ramaria rubella]